MSKSDVLTNKKRDNTGASFTLQNRIKRSIWFLVYTLFFRFTPPQMHAWRIFLLRLFGSKIGQHCAVYPRVKIWAPWNLEMGNYSCLSTDVICYSQSKISIGYY